MAEEKFQYELTLATVATGTGAKQTAVEMERVADGTKKAEDASRRFLTAAEAETQKVQQLVDKARALAAANTAAANSKKDVVRWLDQTADRARATEFAYYDLDAAIGGTNKASATFTAGQTRVQTSSRNSAQALYLFSQGLEDASYGLRGVLNNIPGLVIAMGGTAGLAGAISIGAVALSQIIPLFTKTEEKAGDMADKIQETADNMAKLETDRFEAVGDAIDAARDRAEALKQEFDDTRSAEQSFTTSAIDNAGKLAEVQRGIATALGEQVDSYRELQAIAAAEEQKRVLAAEQAIAAENQKIAAAQEEATLAEQSLAKQQARAQAEQANLIQTRERLQLLLQERAELEKIAERRTTSDDPGRQFIGALFPKTLPLSEEAIGARKTLESAPFKAELEGTFKRVEELERLILTLTKDGGIVAKAENAFLSAQGQLTDLTSAVGINISRIEQTLATDNLVARSQTLATTQEQQARDLTAAVGKIETTTEAGRLAKASIEAAAADGRITANESERLARDSVALIGQIQAGLATAGTNTQETLNLLRTIATREQQTRRELAELRRIVEELQR